MRRIGGILLALGLIAALIPAGAAATGRAPRIKGIFTRSFEWYFQGNSVAIAPDGVPWFGLESEEDPPTLAIVKSRQISLQPVASSGARGLTTALEFDPGGDLWFGIDNAGAVSIGRRAPSGEVSETKLAEGGSVTALTIGHDGRVWFTRGTYGAVAAIGSMTPLGAVTEIELPTGSEPRSITVGPDGAIWFTERSAGQIGRVTPGGEVQLFPAGNGVQPGQIVAGPDGALWFSENGAPGRHGTMRDRIGRISTSGEVTQFPIHFGESTQALAVDPRGFIWFATGRGELASISPSGTVGPRGCIGYCGEPIESIALAPNRSIWWAGGSGTCPGCGGGAALLTQVEGTNVGKVPADALKPPPLP